MTPWPRTSPSTSARHRRDGCRHRPQGHHLRRHRLGPRQPTRPHPHAHLLATRRPSRIRTAAPAHLDPHPRLPGPHPHQIPRLLHHLRRATRPTRPPPRPHRHPRRDHRRALALCRLRPHTGRRPHCRRSRRGHCAEPRCRTRRPKCWRWCYLITHPNESSAAEQEDAAARAWIDRQLRDAPPLSDEQLRSVGEILGLSLTRRSSIRA